MTIDFRQFTRGVLALCAGVCAHVAFAAEFYVSPTATAGGNGTFNNPWKLQTALDHPAAVDPGDTIWLRGGTYTGAPFVSYLVGTSADPIVVRQYPGERAKIDGNYNGNDHTLSIKGSHTWYWGFEIFNSDPTRSSPTPSAPPRRGTGVQQTGAGTRMINMIVHDTSQGVITAEVATGAHIYGSLFYYNGYTGPDRSHGHGIYAQNLGSTYKQMHDNIIFQQFGWGIHAYSEGGHLDRLDFQGNVVFNNGGIDGSWNTNILVGGQTNQAIAPKLISNYSYNTDHDNNNNLGWNAGCTSPTITNNYFSSATALNINDCSSMTITGNTFYGAISGFTQSGFPSNTYYSSRPTGVKVFVRPNAYEAKRANIAIYNWDLLDTVAVDVSGILSPGDGFEVRNAADFFGAPVLTGTYSGGSINLPMDDLSVATPVGIGAPDPAGPEFNAFVLLPASGGGAPSPTPTTTAVPTFTATRTATALPPTATRTPTHTAVPPTATRTATRTATAVPPTATRTPSNTTTAVPPTATRTATRTATGCRPRRRARPPTPLFLRRRPARQREPRPGAAHRHTHALEYDHGRSSDGDRTATRTATGCRPPPHARPRIRPRPFLRRRPGRQHEPRPRCRPRPHARPRTRPRPFLRRRPGRQREPRPRCHPPPHARPRTRPRLFLRRQPARRHEPRPRCRPPPRALPAGRRPRSLRRAHRPRRPARTSCRSRPKPAR